MKYAIFSDIHGNLEAFEAVLMAIDKENPAAYFCVGDIVGYGANPVECIEKVQKLNPTIVCGNHDWAAVELTDVEYFNSVAKKAVLWTRDNLGDEDVEYLKSLKLTYTDTDITLVHGTLDYPEGFSYVLDGYAATKTMALMRTQVCFIGHSHVAGTFYDNKGITGYSESGKIEIRPGNKYLVNVGSVGQPRDGDPRASYCIYDNEKDTIEIKRISYDVAKAQQKILKAGLPRVLAARLDEGK